jgi:superfamily II DNA or RNA helicase
LQKTNQSKKIPQNKNRSLLQLEVQKRCFRQKTSKIVGPMLVVSKTFCSPKSLDEPTNQEKTTSLLFRKMLESLPLHNFIKSHGRNQQKVCFRENDTKQPNEADRRSGKAKNLNDGLETQNSRWKRALYGPTGTFSSRPTLADGSNCKNELETWMAWITKSLQDRHSQLKIKNSHRSGRLRPQNTYRQKTGYSQSSILGIERVESVKILEFGSDEEYQRLCPDGSVYNLEVEENHNYFANGYLVHNCHHVASPTSQKLMLMLAAYFRLGASDTKKEKNPGDIAKIRGLLGPIRYTVPVGIYIDLGRSAKPTIYIVDNPAWNNKFSDLPHIAQPDTPAWALIDNQWRKGTYIGPVYERDNEGKIKTRIKKEVEDKVDEGEVVKEDGTIEPVKMARWKETEVPITVDGFHTLKFPKDPNEYEVESTYCLLERMNDRAIVRFAERNQLAVAWAKYYSQARKFPTLVVCTRTLHIYILESLIGKAIGPEKVQILLGDHTSKERDTAFDWFRHTPGGVLISPLVQEGVSINEIRGGVIVDYVGDWERANQIIGRFIRKKQGENEAHITWFFDNQHETLRRGSKRVLNRLFDIRGYTFVHPVLGPETVSRAKVYKKLD